jgi:uncharacterized OB-fold protein
MSLSSREFAFFYEGLEQGELLMQSCTDCSSIRNPPTTMCPKCGSFAWAPVRMSGQGTVYSYTVHHYPPLEGFALPHPVGVVQLEEGVRVVAGLDGLEIADLEIDKPVKVEFMQRNGQASFRFGLA